MTYTGRLHVDIAGSISALHAITKEFGTRTKLYRVLLQGKGLEFESYRQYSYDDDANTIDWKASKRTNHLLVKQYREERNLKVMFFIDVGDSMVSGSADALKCEYAAEIAASFAELINRSGDMFGYVLYSDHVGTYVKPQRNKPHFSRFTETLCTGANYGGPSRLDVALRFALEAVKRDVVSLIFISDFLTFNEHHVQQFSLLARKFETMAVMVKDTLDHTLPNIRGEVSIRDPQTGNQMTLDPSLARPHYEKFAREQEQFFRSQCRLNGIDLLELTTNRPFIPSLAAFLKERIAREAVYV